MDVALILILPLVGGYYFACHWNFTKFRCAREDGHRLYFRAALYGTFLFLIAFILRTTFKSSLVYESFEVDVIKFLEPLLKKPNKDNIEGTPPGIVITAIYSLILSLPLGLLLNIGFWKGPCLRRAIKDNDLEKLIYAAVHKPMPLSITMENKKVYVGYVVGGINPSQHRKMLSIFPLLSGYRDEEGDLKFTTFYTDIYEKIETRQADHLIHLSTADFETVLPVDKIQSMNMFDVIAYEEFQKKSSPKKKRK